MKHSYTFVFGLLLLMLSFAPVRAQMAPDSNGHYRPTKGLSDPEQPDPRYASSVEVNELKDQIKLLTDAYSRLVEQHNQQADRLQTLERATRTAGPPAPGNYRPTSSPSASCSETLLQRLTWLPAAASILKKPWPMLLARASGFRKCQV
ncbi:hypothetical protein [Hymenobacter cellulosivorans]|uniref:YbgF trimerisation domain-containing protein n=1 Tax=Hymenobacter cellulosivorans TaxID=2932249 RepID=A0ABY4F400_9BACT|nr:hypothetical protein [Hymenobacter cellulosivorans]UOQ51020.1 hypothetical protein MUN80_14765 [Hymenobacter cellulosivorans]